MADPKGERGDLVKIFACNVPGEVEMARELLANLGIDAFVFDAHTGRIGSLFLAAAIPPRLMVFAADAARASQILNDFGFAS